MAIQRLPTMDDLRYLMKFGRLTNLNARVSGRVASAVTFPEAFPFACSGVHLTYQDLTSPNKASAATLGPLIASAITLSSFAVITDVITSGWIGDTVGIAWQAFGE